ncbi:Hypothetical predicted protein [Paramuricea clavata]|uniref:Uncharacterized protein n=1 Tax=Paramuricea clavata TaxID=317549 RepID=A0A6S7J1K6_PARCT|nr:Hypothetical predicted protein [Paramuricea clavata]
MSYEEMDMLADVLPTMSKSAQATNYAELGESKDSYEPSTHVTPPAASDCWSESFDKFYINKNYDWKRIANIIRDFCCDAYNALNSSNSTAIDVIPPTPTPTTPVEQKQLDPPKKRKNNATKGGAETSKKKKTKVVLSPDNERENEVRPKFKIAQDRATKIIMMYMCRYKKDCEETIAQFGKEMYELCPYP